MSYKVFIDGSSGTTGLRIADRLAGRPELELLTIAEEDRKKVEKRAEVINSADLAFLCLPDAASKEVIPLVKPEVKVLDTSTAFRTAPGWVYGFPELRGQREKIRTASRVAVPGCHASAASSSWPGPWWSWGWCRRIIPSAATASPAIPAAARR